MGTEPTKPLLRALGGETLPLTPWWLMRQAGRYLPEYRQVRATANSFIELCLNPSLAAELTLQPIRRFGMDGAILFSDILMLPCGLGQDLTFLEVEGRGSRDFRLVKSWAYRDPQGFDGLIELLAESTIEYLTRQIEAGAEVVQLFDSWAGALPEWAFIRWVIEPTKRIVAALKTRFPHCPIIGFPRGAGVLHEDYLRETRIAGISLDTAVPLVYAREKL